MPVLHFYKNAAERRKTEYRQTHTVVNPKAPPGLSACTYGYNSEGTEAVVWDTALQGPVSSLEKSEDRLLEKCGRCKGGENSESERHTGCYFVLMTVVRLA